MTLGRSMSRFLSAATSRVVLLMYGIPNMKLDKSAVARRVKLMEDLGVTFKTGVDVGKDVTIGQLKKDFNAVAICAGRIQAA